MLAFYCNRISGGFLLLNVKTLGVIETRRYLSHVADKLRGNLPAIKAMGLALLGSFQRNMTKGVDPAGRPLPPPARWTRIAGRGAGTGKGRMTGKMIPLLNTGHLRASMNVWDVTAKGVTVGWKGGMLTIAGNMQNGTPGMMAVRTKKIKGYYSGMKYGKKGGYVRVNNDGQWITRKMTGNMILVHPLKRVFFFVTAKQAKLAENVMKKYKTRRSRHE